MDQTRQPGARRAANVDARLVSNREVTKGDARATEPEGILREEEEVESASLLARLRIRHRRRGVMARRDDALPVGAERLAVDPVGVPLEGEGLLPRLRVPHV